MSIGTYSELQSAVAAWIKRDDLSDRIPEFITLCEVRIKQLLRVREMVSVQTLTVTSGTAEVSQPARYIQARSFYIDSSPKTRLRYVSPDVFIENWISRSSDVPEVFTEIGSQFILGATPGSDYTGYMTCFTAAAALSDAAPSNALLTAYPNIYLFGALAESSAYTMHDERLPLWESRFSQAVEEANKAYKKSMVSGSSLETQLKRNVP